MKSAHHKHPQCILGRYNDVCLRDEKIKCLRRSWRTIHTSQEFVHSLKQPEGVNHLSFWKTASNQRQYLDWLEEQLGIRDTSEWYSIRPSVISKHGGKILLDKYGRFLYSILSSVYPERKYLPWKFSKVPSSHWNSLDNQRAFFDWIGSQLGYENKADFYKLSAKQVHEFGGSFIYPRYSNSVYKALQSIYPEHTWLPWKFNQVPKSFWQDPSNRKGYLDWLAAQLEINALDKWYEVTPSIVRKHGGDTLLQMYNGNMYLVLSAFYPDHKWIPWKFSYVPEGFWNSLDNQKQYFEWLVDRMGLKEDEWYKIKASDFRVNGGGTLIQQYGSVENFLSKIHTEKNLASWKFSKVSDDYWNHAENITAYFALLGKSLGIQELDEWYLVPTSQIHGGLMKRFNSSLLKVLCTAFPNHKWLPWKFQRVPRGYWNSPENQKAFIEWFEKQMGIATTEQWYQVTLEDIFRHGGLSLLKLYKFSLVELLQSVYPHTAWEPWRFVYAAKSEWSQDPSAISRLVQDLSDKLYIQTLDDWYRVSVKQIYHAGGAKLIHHFGNLPKMLQELYPQHNWNPIQFNSTHKKASQRWLKIILERIFPGKDYVHPSLIQKGSLDKIELDLFLPDLLVAFEYQGEQHYENKFFFGSQLSYRQRDFKKRSACEAAGITLIEIPYWWNRREESLRSTIAKIRPDLLSSSETPIPDEPPAKQHRGPKLSDPVDWQVDSNPDPKGWLLSPKHEGIRAYWNGKKLLAKSGKQIKVPGALLSHLPTEVCLDGELWAEGGSFEDLVSIVNSQSHTNLWKRVKFFVYDIPTLDLPLEERLKRLMELPSSEFVEKVSVIECKGPDHLEKYLDEMITQGASGVLLRAPTSKYEAGRSTSCRKYIKYQRSFLKFVKAFPQNCGILCEQMNGLLCIARCGDSVFREPPPPGTIVEIEHAGLWKSGRFKHPTFIQSKLELSWQQLVSSSKRMY